MNRKYVIGFCIFIIIILFGIVAIKTIKNSQQATITQLSNVHKKQLPKEVTITLTKNGFTPNQVTVKVGTAVRWKNESGAQQTVNSDNYPTNQLHKELNFGVFANNSSVVYIFKKPGTYGYHNQFHPNQKGKIIVVQ